MGSPPNRDNLRTALAAAGIGSWEWSAAGGDPVPDGTLVRLFGLDPEQAPEWATLRGMIDAEDLSSLIASVDDDRIEREIRIRRVDRSERLLAVRGAAVQGGNGKPRQLAGIAYDVTEQHRTEEERLRFRQASEAAFRAKNRLLATVYPEIRTPLSAVLGGLDFMLGTDLPDQQRDCLELAREAAGSLQRLIEDLVEFTRLQAGEVTLAKSHFKLSKCVSDVLEAMLPLAEERDVGLKMRISQHLPEAVVGDPQRLRQLLAMLLRLALEQAEGGEVGVSVDGGGAVAGEDETSVGIVIISPVSTLSERFGNGTAWPRRRAEDPPPSGSDGISLAVCQALLEMMRGEMEIRSEEGETAIRLKLRFRHSLPEGKREQSPRILLAEDDPIIRELLEISLKKKNWQTVSAENGEKALAEWRKGDFDLLLIDIQMPEVDGLEVARIIREQERGTGTHLPIIAITAHARDEDRTSCLAAGMDDYLSKPIRMGDLYQVVMRQLNSRGSKH